MDEVWLLTDRRLPTAEWSFAHGKGNWVSITRGLLNLDAASSSYGGRWNRSMHSTSLGGGITARPDEIPWQLATRHFVSWIHRVGKGAQLSAIERARGPLASGRNERCCLPPCKVLPNAEKSRTRNQWVLELVVFAQEAISG